MHEEQKKLLPDDEKGDIPGYRSIDEYLKIRAGGCQSIPIPEHLYYEYYLGRPVWEKMITWNDLFNISIEDLNELHFNLDIKDYFKVKYGE